MLAKKDRLSRKEFDEVWARGRRRHTPLFTLVTLEGCAAAKYAVVAGKKVAKTAVGRTRLRRRGYQVVRELRLAHHFPTTSVLLLLKPAAASADYASLRAALAAAFSLPPSEVE